MSAAAGPEEERLLMRRRADTQILEAKLTREARRIINLKVNQYATNWKLKERIDYLNTIRETQQQNIIDLQMQYERLDEMYQNELRMRDDTLNKVQSTKSICDVLEEHCGRIFETLLRCQTDRDHLFEAYRTVVEVVRDVKCKHAQAEDAQRAVIHNLEQRISIISKNKEELNDNWTNTKNVLQNVIADLQERVNFAELQVKESQKLLREEKVRNELINGEISQTNKDIDEKNRQIKELECELARVNCDYTEKTNDMMLKINEREQCLLEKDKNLDILSSALVNQENFTKTIQNQNIQLLEKVASGEDEKANLLKQLSKLEHELEQTTHSLHCCQHEINTLNQNNSEIILQYQQKEQEMSNALLGSSNNIDTLNQKNAELVHKCDEQEKIIVQLQVQLQKEKEELVIQMKCMNQTEMSLMELKNQEIFEFKSQIAELEEKYNELRESTEKQLLDQTAQYQRELAGKMDIINKLMSDFRTETDLRYELEASIDKLKMDIEFGQNMQRLKDNLIKVKNEDLSNLSNKLRQLFKEKEMQAREIVKLRQKLSHNASKTQELTKTRHTMDEQDENRHLKMIPQTSAVLIHDASEQAMTSHESRGSTAGPSAPPGPGGVPENPVIVTFVGPTIPQFEYNFSDGSIEGVTPERVIPRGERSGAGPVRLKRMSTSNMDDTEYVPKTKERIENKLPKRDMPTRTKRFVPSKKSNND